MAKITNSQRTSLGCHNSSNDTKPTSANKSVKSGSPGPARIDVSSVQETYDMKARDIQRQEFLDMLKAEVKAEIRKEALTGNLWNDNLEEEEPTSLIKWRQVLKRELFDDSVVSAWFSQKG